MYGAIDLNPLDSPRSSGRSRHAGESVLLLLSERALPRLRPARAGQLDRLRPLRQGPSTPDAVLPHLQGAVLRAQGDTLVRVPTDRGEGPVDLRAPRRAQWRPRHRAAGEGEPQHRGPLQSVGRRPRPAAPRRAGGVFPPTPARSSSTRSGRSSSRSRSIATRLTRPTTSMGTGGTTSRSTPRAGWCWPSCPGRGTPRASRRSLTKSRIGPEGG